jgi:carbon storage regulator CsrA
MLVLSRKPGQQIRIGDSIVVSVVDCGRNRVTVGIDAPPDVRVVRSERSSLQRPRLAANDSQPPRILIVDDNPTDREICRRFLSADAAQAYEFVEADSAESGLELLQSTGPDCVLLDYRLPDLSGIEFLSELKRRQLPSNCPVVMLTSYGSEDLVVEAMKEGASDYLKKGNLTPELLQQRVRGLVSASSSYNTSA